MYFFGIMSTFPPFLQLFFWPFTFRNFCKNFSVVLALFSFNSVWKVCGGATEPDHSRFSTIFREITPLFMTKIKWALDRRTILCLYDPGFHRQTFEHVPKCECQTSNVNFVGTFVVPQIQQQSNIIGCSGFGNCKWIAQNVSGIRKTCEQSIRKCKRIPQTVSGLRILFFTELAYE